MTLSSEDLEIYKLAIEGIRQNEAKRQNAKSIYAAIMVGIATVTATVDKPNYILIAILALAVSCLWYLTIRYHKDLANAKWNSVKYYQEKLSHSPFDVEWEDYKSCKRKVDLTTIEKLLPVTIGVCALLYLVCRIFTAF